MQSIYVLDTNSYALLFQHPKPPAYEKLKTLVTHEHTLSFYIPEIVSMEIHSVLGKFRRSKPSEQLNQCARQIKLENNVIACSHMCITPPKPSLKPKIYKAILKVLRDIEKKQGTIQADLLPLSSDEISEGKSLLQDFAHRYSFGSHDALVAGTVVAASQKGLSLTLVTSDKGLKAVCGAKNIPHIDPNLL